MDHLRHTIHVHASWNCRRMHNNYERVSRQHSAKTCMYSSTLVSLVGRTNARNLFDLYLVERLEQKTWVTCLHHMLCEREVCYASLGILERSFCMLWWSQAESCWDKSVRQFSGRKGVEAILGHKIFRAAGMLGANSLGARIPPPWAEERPWAERWWTVVNGRSERQTFWTWVAS